jgi:hypothetical protein
MSSPKRHLSLQRKKPITRLVNFHLTSKSMQLKLYSLFKCRFTWLMSSSKLQSCLELCQFVQVFLKTGLQNIKRVPFRLARVFHSWLSSEQEWHITQDT